MKWGPECRPDVRVTRVGVDAPKPRMGALMRGLALARVVVVLSVSALCTVSVAQQKPDLFDDALKQGTKDQEAASKLASPPASDPACPHKIGGTMLAGDRQKLRFNFQYSGGACGLRRLVVEDVVSVTDTGGRCVVDPKTNYTAPIYKICYRGRGPYPE
jgi:hypothetical protein